MSAQSKTRDSSFTGPRPAASMLRIAPYEQGKSDINNEPAPIKLSSNESSFGPSPKAVEAYHQAADKLHRYPDGAQTKLRQAIAEVHGLEPSRIVCGNGSEELIGLLVRAFVEPGEELIISENHFVMCRIYGLAQGAEVIMAPEQDFGTDVDAVLERVTPKTRMVALANPNNPTGTYLPRSEIQRLHGNLPNHVLLLLDGAYAEYVDAKDYDPGMDLAHEAENVVMTRTFSKIYGLAGLRIGWAYCPGEVIDIVQRIRTPFNANSAAMAAATAAVQDQPYIQQIRRHNARWLNSLSEELTALGLRVVPSVANFYLVVFDGSSGKNAADAAAALEARGIVLRPLRAAGAEQDVLRITVGNDEENQSVLEAFRAYMNSG